MAKHILSVWLKTMGVLSRVAGLVQQEGFNIESLAVGVTENPEVSRMTIVSMGTIIRLNRLANN